MGTLIGLIILLSLTQYSGCADSKTLTLRELLSAYSALYERQFHEPLPANQKALLAALPRFEGKSTPRGLWSAMEASRAFQQDSDNKKIEHEKKEMKTEDHAKESSEEPKEAASTTTTAASLLETSPTEKTKETTVVVVEAVSTTTSAPKSDAPLTTENPNRSASSSTGKPPAKTDQAELPKKTTQMEDFKDIPFKLQDGTTPLKSTPALPTQPSGAALSDPAIAMKSAKEASEKLQTIEQSAPQTDPPRSNPPKQDASGTNPEVLKTENAGKHTPLRPIVPSPTPSTDSDHSQKARTVKVTFLSADEIPKKATPPPPPPPHTAQRKEASPPTLEAHPEEVKLAAQPVQVPQTATPNAAGEPDPKTPQTAARPSKGKPVFIETPTPKLAKQAPHPKTTPEDLKRPALVPRQRPTDPNPAVAKPNQRERFIPTKPRPNVVSLQVDNQRSNLKVMNHVVVPRLPSPASTLQRRGPPRGRTQSRRFQQTGPAPLPAAPRGHQQMREAPRAPPSLIVIQDGRVVQLSAQQQRDLGLVLNAMAASDREASSRRRAPARRAQPPVALRSFRNRRQLPPIRRTRF